MYRHLETELHRIPAKSCCIHTLKGTCESEDWSLPLPLQTLRKLRAFLGHPAVTNPRSQELRQRWSFRL